MAHGNPYNPFCKMFGELRTNIFKCCPSRTVNVIFGEGGDTTFCGISANNYQTVLPTRSQAEIMDFLIELQLYIATAILKYEVDSGVDRAALISSINCAINMAATWTSSAEFAKAIVEYRDIVKKQSAANIESQIKELQAKLSGMK